MSVFLELGDFANPFDSRRVRSVRFVMDGVQFMPGIQEPNNPKELLRFLCMIFVRRAGLH